MAALLHQAALQPPPHPWPQNSHLSPPRIALSKHRRAPTRQLHASGSGNGRPTGSASAATDSESTTTKVPSSKKKTRKEKQQLRRRQQELLLEASAAKAIIGGGGGEEEYDDDELPQPVFDRILRRILFLVGVPMATGVGLLNVYHALESGQGVAVPAWVPLLTILLSFGTSALGIAYGTLSASWDPEKDGSLLGLDEARTNWPELWKEEIEKAKKMEKK